MARAGRIVAGTLALMREIVRPGISTEDLDAAAERFIRSHDGATPSFKGLYGFPKTLCTSIDEEIVHGIPSAKRVLSEGSIVSVDVGVQLEGLHADSATTLPVGEITPGGRAAARGDPGVSGGRASRRRGSGNHVGDIGHAVQQVAEGAGYGVVRELVGHGIGTRFHEEPQVPNYGSPKRGPAAARGDDARHRADDHDRQPGHQDPGRQVDRGHRRRQPLGPLRAHRRHHRQRAEDPHRRLRPPLSAPAAPAAAAPAAPTSSTRSSRSLAVVDRPLGRQLVGRVLQVAPHRPVGAPGAPPRPGRPRWPRRRSRVASPRCAIASARSAACRPAWRSSSSCTSAPSRSAAALGALARLALLAGARRAAPARGQSRRRPRRRARRAPACSARSRSARSAHRERPARAPRRTAAAPAVSPATICDQRGRERAGERGRGAARRGRGRRGERVEPVVQRASAAGSASCEPGHLRAFVGDGGQSCANPTSVSSSQACIAGLPAHSAGVLDARRGGRRSRSPPRPPRGRAECPPRCPRPTAAAPRSRRTGRRRRRPGRAPRSRAAGCRWSRAATRRELAPGTRPAATMSLKGNPVPISANAGSAMVETASRRSPCQAPPPREAA